MPGEQAGPPCSQHFQAAVSLGREASGKGSLNRSKITASLPAKVAATEDQNRIDSPESGIGFWQTASAEAHPEDGPVYAPSLQCRSRIATMPLAFSKLT